MTAFTIQNSEDPMATLCRMALETTYDDLPDEVVTHAKHTLLDAVGVMIGGSGMDGIPEIVELVKTKGGVEQTPLPFYGGRVPAAEAALAIGPMPRAMDCGDLHEEAGHISEYIVASLLAATGLRESVSGREFLAALVVGQEILIRIGSAYKVISTAVKSNDCGGHYIFGAVAAVGKLIGLTQDELENALGIARTMTQPHTMGIYAPATLMVRVHHGLVCQSAITACLLAQKGITGPRQSVLLGPNGFLRTAQWETDPDALTRDLGEQWEMTRITTKGYSACYFSHSSIDGIIEQMRDHDFNATDIEKIHIEVSTSGWRAVCEPVDRKWDPHTVPECQFSLPYAVATAAVDGHVFLDSYSTESRSRDDVRELMTRITAEEVPAVSDWGARVHTTLRDGRTIDTEHVYVKGHPDNPFSEQDFIDKFRMCVPYSVIPLSIEVQESIVKHALELEHSGNVVDDLLLPLTP
ncbi:MmgE/PrpD family protein [Gordonia rhizosphera]|uniref:2-methylcitrate dehydratase n=1 Tax=Gordonia rhizosphera NBRC 16068 TaxID=1108045 RepID=K6X158_9ACTN|nr:MmgE/PrpD family protein [Gordonia rhizosphera]GAB92544.1 2-methylcitrate dehydratase [Gordonia rhizosphera NBRC 16068]